MSGTPTEDPAAGGPDERDLLAAEYVLGVLDEAGMLDVRRQAETDTALSTSIDEWQERLYPLAVLADPVAAPQTLWSRIEASLGLGASNDNKRPGLWRSAALWRGTTVAALALAAAFAGVLLVRPLPPVAIATLAPASAPGSVFLAQIGANGAVQVRPLGQVDVPTDRDLQLWALPPGATAPISLGVMVGAARSVTIAGLPTAGTQLLVSLEPKGGSPTGQPTGPVLYAGRLTAIN